MWQPDSSIHDNPNNQLSTILVYYIYYVLGLWHDVAQKSRVCLWRPAFALQGGVRGDSHHSHTTQLPKASVMVTWTWPVIDHRSTSHFSMQNIELFMHM